MSVYLQDPNSTLDWAHDWTDWLNSGDSISTRQWTITPSATLTNATSETVTAGGLTAGNVYRLSELVTTANGLEGERSIIIRCGER